jgi:hypothetical protein
MACTAVRLQHNLTNVVSVFAEYERDGKQQRNGAENIVLRASVKDGFQVLRPQ